MTLTFLLFVRLFRRYSRCLLAPFVACSHHAILSSFQERLYSEFLYICGSTLCGLRPALDFSVQFSRFALWAGYCTVYVLKVEAADQTR